MKKILEIILNILARGYLRKYEPMIIGITGNVGKTTTKEAIATVASAVKSVRVNAGNLNNEIGLPLTILGNYADEYYSSGASASFWLRVLWNGFAGLIIRQKYPEILVLEYGADHPGDIKKLARRFRPHISVITAVGEIPVHVEYFQDKEHVAREKSELIKILSESDYAVLNQDDLLVVKMAHNTKAKTVFYGFAEDSQLKLSSYDYTYDEGGRPIGVSFKINQGISFVPVRVAGSLGKSIALSCGAAAAVGRILGLNLVGISEALSRFRGQPGRLRILPGIKGSIIIDDTYNASPAAVNLALEVLRDINGPRKIAVLGDMLELGEHSIKAHQAAGNMAGNIADVLVCVGARAKFIADSAADQMLKENIYSFGTSDEARLKVQESIREGDVILAKGSQGMRMEKIVEEIMAEPERRNELLVRQSKRWLEK